MEIPEVKDLTMTALGHDHIKVGCVEFALSSIKSYRNATTTMGAMVFWHCQHPYWLTLADCDRALRLMNEYQEPKAIPPAKFEIGQQVRCRCNHHHGQNPYRVEYKKLVQGDWIYGYEGVPDCCMENDLEIVQEPKPTPKFLDIGLLLEGAGLG